MRRTRTSRRRCPRSPRPTPRIEAASGAAAKGAILRDLFARSDPLTAKYIVKVLAGRAPDRPARRASSRRRSPSAYDRPLDEVKWAGMLTGDVGQAGRARPREPARRRQPRGLPPDQVHARLAGRGRRGDPRATRAGGLGRGQVRRHPGPAPQAGPRRPALQPRPPRRQRPVPGGRRGGRAAQLGRDPRRRAARLPRRRRPAVPVPPVAARAEVAVRRDPGRGPGDLRGLRPPRRRRPEQRPDRGAPPGAARGASNAPRRDRSAVGRRQAAGSPDPT